MKISKIIDNRTLRKATYDYHRAKKREKQVMSALTAKLMAYGHDPSWEFVDRDEAWLDGKKHTTPDTYLWFNDKQYTIEIKYSNTGDFINDEIYIKCAAIISMKNYPKKYPRGMVLIATKRNYCRMKISEVMKYPIQPVPEWGYKKAYVIPVSSVEWEPWLVQIEE